MGRNRRASMAALSAAVLPALLAALPGSPPAMRAAAGPRDAERGLYVLAGDFPPSRWREIVDAPGIAGVAVTLTWRRVEPREGEFDWAELDEALAVATSMGRLVTLRLVPGIHTPEWVYAGGAHRFRFTDRNPGHDAATYGRMNPDYATFGKELSLPVPWDEAFLAPWLRTVGAMGAHLGGCEGLGMVHVTAANTHGTEMFLPRGKEDRARWLEAGYSKERLISVWRRAVDAFAAAFPDAPLALDLSPTLFRDGVAASVARYGVERRGPRFLLQNNILLAENPSREREDWSILEAYAGRTTIGFQRQVLRIARRDDLGASQKRELRRRNLEGMLVQGLALGAGYFELGARDVRDFPDVVRDFAPTLER